MEERKERKNERKDERKERCTVGSSNLIRTFSLFKLKIFSFYLYQFQKPKNKIFLELITWKVKHDGKKRSNYSFRSASRVVINDFNINQVRFYENSSWNFE
jgi:hypothetical protein